MQEEVKEAKKRLLESENLNSELSKSEKEGEDEEDELPWDLMTNS